MLDRRAFLGRLAGLVGVAITAPALAKTVLVHKDPEAGVATFNTEGLESWYCVICHQLNKTGITCKTCGHVIGRCDGPRSSAQGFTYLANDNDVGTYQGVRRPTYPTLKAEVYNPKPPYWLRRRKVASVKELEKIYPWSSK